MTSGCSVKMIASSISEDTGIRLDTLQVRYWRPIHGEVMTHRVFSRNASSSRAIPAASIWAREEVYVPRFRKNKPGMQPGDFLTPAEQGEAERIWREMAAYILERTAELSDKKGLNIHKQWVNRPLEWFGYIEVLVTSTEWSNFDALRDHPEAQDEIEALAKEIRRVRDATIPKTLKHGQWHLPYVGDGDIENVERMLKSRRFADGVEEALHMLAQAPGLRDLSPRNKLLLAISAARACRVSYSKHDGEAPAISDDMRRFLQLAGSDPKHASPLEHQARPLTSYENPFLSGNFVGWAQFRKFLPNECL